MVWQLITAHLTIVVVASIRVLSPHQPIWFGRTMQVANEYLSHHSVWHDWKVQTACENYHVLEAPNCSFNHRNRWFYTGAPHPQPTNLVWSNYASCYWMLLWFSRFVLSIEWQSTFRINGAKIVAISRDPKFITSNWPAHTNPRKQGAIKRRIHHAVPVPISPCKWPLTDIQNGFIHLERAQIVRADRGAVFQRPIPGDNTNYREFICKFDGRESNLTH